MMAESHAAAAKQRNMGQLTAGQAVDANGRREGHALKACVSTRHSPCASLVHHPVKAAHPLSALYWFGQVTLCCELQRAVAAARQRQQFYQHIKVSGQRAPTACSHETAKDTDCGRMAVSTTWKHTDTHTCARARHD